jgi:hypothetical protein
LDDEGKAIVKKLREWAGELLAKLVGKKQKCECDHSRFCVVEDADALASGQALIRRMKPRLLKQNQQALTQLWFSQKRRMQL